MRKTLTSLLAVAATIALAGCGGSDATSDTSRADARPKPAKAAAKELDRDARKIAYEGEDGETALDLLREEGYDVEVQSSELGDYVTAIGDVAATKTEFWLFEVDGKMPNVGADAYETRDGQRVEWRYGS